MRNPRGRGFKKGSISGILTGKDLFDENKKKKKNSPTSPRPNRGAAMGESLLLGGKLNPRQGEVPKSGGGFIGGDTSQLGKKKPSAHGGAPGGSKRSVCKIRESETKGGGAGDPKASWKNPKIEPGSKGG